MANYGVMAETLLIVGTGMYIHLKEISVVDLNASKLPGLRANASSALFVFSVLCILARIRTLWWPQCLKKPGRVLAFVIDLALCLYLTDLLVRQVWIPILKFLNYACNTVGRYSQVGAQEFLPLNALPVAKWIRNKGYYCARFCLAAGAFLLMAEVTGLSEVIKRGFNQVCRGEVAESSAMPVSSDRLDLIEFAAVIEDSDGGRKKKTGRRTRSRRRARRDLNAKSPNEYKC